MGKASKSAKRPKKIITKSSVAGIKVYDSKGYFVGTVKDLAFDLENLSNMSILIDGKESDYLIPVTYIGSFGDIIILKENTPLEDFAQEKPQPPKTAYEPARCPTCGTALLYYPKYGWYCPKCKKYVTVPESVLAHVPKCQTCGNYLSYIEDYGKWYCYNCNKYVDVGS